MPALGRWLHVALGLAVLAPSCNCPGDPVELPDAGEDAGRDAGPDAGRDAGGEQADAGDDASMGDGMWLELPGLPERCENAVAIDPASVVPGLRFEACPDRPEGCRQLVVDWESREDDRLLAIGDGYHDGTRGYFLLNRPDPEAPDERIQNIVADDSGSVLAVFRSRYPTRGCGVFTAAIGEGRFMLAVANISTAGSAFWLFGGDFAGAAETVRMIAHPDLPDGAVVKDLRTGAAQSAFQASEAGTLHRVGWDGSVTRIEDGDGVPVHGRPGSILGRDLVFDCFGCGRERIVISTDGGPPRPLIEPAEPEAEALLHARTDGRTIAWLQGFRRVRGSASMFERIDLYASDYADRADAIVPVLLETTSRTTAHTAIVGGFGHAAILAADGSDGNVIRLYRVSDGHETELTPPPGRIWTWYASYIGPSEMMLVAGPTVLTSDTVQLIDYTHLEPDL